MRAIVLTELIGPDGLELREIADPPAPEGSVVIQVGAAGVNYPDLLAMRGAYQLRTPPPFVAGNEIAGTVVEAAPRTGFAPGERVMALCGTGGYAERVAVPAGLVVRTPAGRDDAEAVALVANHQTAYFSLVLRAGLRPGDRVVVLGAAGGLGSASVQVAVTLGARVVAVVHRDGADAFVRDLGAEAVVRLTEGWGRQVRDLIGGADVLVDPVGGEAFDEAVRVVAPGGRLVVLGFAGGDIPVVKVNRLLMRNASVVGAGWGEWLRGDPGGAGRGGRRGGGAGGQGPATAGDRPLAARARPRGGRGACARRRAREGRPRAVRLTRAGR